MDKISAKYQHFGNRCDVGPCSEQNHLPDRVDDAERDDKKN
jgi:hypothetical protein